MRVGGAAAAPIAVGVLLAILVLSNERTQARLQTERDVRANVADTVTQVRTEVRNQLSAATAAAAPNDLDVPAGRLAGSGIDVDTATQARDTDTALLDDTTKPPSIIVPVFRAGAAVDTSAQRRAAITSYRLVPLALLPLTEQLVAPGGGLVVRGPNAVISASPGLAPSDASTYSVDMDITGSPGWDVEAWQPDPGTPGIAWFWAGGLLALAIAAAVAALRLVRRERVSDARRRQLERDRRLVNGLAPVLQASLDLGEVVPAVSSHLSDGMGLAGLSLTAPTDRGERQLFATGVVPSATVNPTIRPPAELAPGETFALSLTRGGRVLGVLRVVAGDPLSNDDLVALMTAGELLGSTLANAEAYARQQDLVERMRSVDELKTVFLATASHELRTPVTAIVGFSALLLQQWDNLDPTQGRGLMQRVHSNSKRLEALTEQLLDFAQLERGLARSDDKVLDLGAVVGQILADQPELASTHVVDTQLATGCLIRGSRAAMERILTNLVGNAAKYSPSGTRICVTVRHESDRCVLLVDDEGSGVPEADRERVFSRFYRGNGDAVIRTRGAGVGLAIVAEYAASMSGHASVRESPSGGARFSVSFAAVRALATADVTDRQGESDVAHT